MGNRGKRSTSMERCRRPTTSIAHNVVAALSKRLSQGRAWGGLASIVREPTPDRPLPTKKFPPMIAGGKKLYFVMKRNAVGRCSKQEWHSDELSLKYMRANVSPVHASSGRASCVFSALCTTRYPRQDICCLFYPLTKVGPSLGETRKPELATQR